VSTPEPHPRRGHLYWVRIPDEPGRKRRPALVVSPDSRNRLASDVIVIPLSSVLREAPTHVRLRAREGGLERPSMAKCEQITTLRVRSSHAPSNRGEFGVDPDGRDRKGGAARDRGAGELTQLGSPARAGRSPGWRRRTSGAAIALQGGRLPDASAYTCSSRQERIRRQARSIRIGSSVRLNG
jgi:mRNA-degrading endonuclease toxin of MazEF toxin-antitoxin module